jgi:hypothetical protein
MMSPREPRLAGATASSFGGGLGQAAAAIFISGGVKEEPLEPTQGHGRGLQVLLGDRGLMQQLDMPLMHRLRPVAQLHALFGQPNMDRPAIVYRPLLREIAVQFNARSQFATSASVV